MAYAPQRRHAVASLANAAQALGLLQHLYAPNALILVARILVQMQIAAAAFVHPTRSLLALFAMLTLLNVTAVMLHLLDYAAGSNGGKGLMLDFVGQAHPASLTRILLLDLSLYVLQTTGLVVSYITHHGANIPISSSLPSKDLLLPSQDAATHPNTSEDGEVDIESGEGSRRRKGKGAAYSSEEADPALVWLNEEDQGEDDAGMDASDRTRLLSKTAGSSRRRRIRDPPHIFSLSIPHMVNLVIRLPAPLPGPRAFSGGTPDVTPLATPTPEIPPPLPSATTTVATAHTESEDDWESDAEDTDGRFSPSARRGRRLRGAAGVVADIGRIPGAYRTTGESGDGG